MSATNNTYQIETFQPTTTESMHSTQSLNEQMQTMKLDDTDVDTMRIGMKLLCALVVMEQHSKQVDNTIQMEVSNIIHEDKQLLHEWIIDLTNENIHTRQIAQSMISTLKEKYIHSGPTLISELQRLCHETINSTQGKEIIRSGDEVVNEWAKFGYGIKGQSLISSFTTLLLDHSFTMTNILTQHQSNSSDTMINAATKVYEKLSNDPDVQQMANKGKLWIENKENVTNVVSKVTGESKEDINKKLETPVVQAALPQVIDVIEKVPEKLKPDVVVETTKEIVTNAETRQTIITQIKDFILTFLLHYLPNLPIPDVEGNDETVEYKISKLHLSNFQCRSEDVDVILIENGIEIHAINLNCEVKDMEWSYKQHSFPYLNGNGIATAKGENIIFDCKLMIQNLKENITTITPNLADSLDISTEKQPILHTSYESSIQQLDNKSDYPLELVFESCHITIPSFTLQIGENWLAFVYNLLLKLFSGVIRENVEREANKALDEHASSLLEQLNTSLHDYLPTFAQYARKVDTIVVESIKEVAQESNKDEVRDYPNIERSRV